ncbi:protein C10 [Tribolium castaneum]|uniref:Protein C10 n=1 Tax=Tribolium castaneum TaxID=7070 RepID=D6WZ32_TRICA|nr:PREDICTED: protein C10 [Tribolium castaneum]EFA07825.2 Protein C10-like Protein [Tribolium castaneum]|eukprot:XP_971983.1 PREDICTED: protein C10 [Tribolium castaneum]
MARSETMPVLTSELAIEILGKTLEELQTPQNVKKLDEAKDNVGNEMLKMMQFLFPIVMQVQMDVIKEFGFPGGRDGIIKFAQMLRSLEREDAEVARLNALIKAYYLPPVSVNTGESPAEERASS